MQADDGRRPSTGKELRLGALRHLDSTGAAPGRWGRCRESTGGGASDGHRTIVVSVGPRGWAMCRPEVPDSTAVGVRRLWRNGRRRGAIAAAVRPDRKTVEDRDHGRVGPDPRRRGRPARQRVRAAVIAAVGCSRIVMVRARHHPPALPGGLQHARATGAVLGTPTGTRCIGDHHVQVATAPILGACRSDQPLGRCSPPEA